MAVLQNLLIRKGLYWIFPEKCAGEITVIIRHAQGFPPGSASRLWQYKKERTGPKAGTHSLTFLDGLSLDFLVG